MRNASRKHPKSSGKAFALSPRGSPFPGAFFGSRMTARHFNSNSMNSRRVALVFLMLRVSKATSTATSREIVVDAAGSRQAATEHLTHIRKRLRPERRNRLHVLCSTPPVHELPRDVHRHRDCCRRFAQHQADLSKNVGRSTRPIVARSLVSIAVIPPMPKHASIWGRSCNLGS
jgi:hypothetical protein